MTIYLPQEDLQPLHYAAIASQVEMVQLLVDVYGVSPNTTASVCAKFRPPLVPHCPLFVFLFEEESNMIHCFFLCFFLLFFCMLQEGACAIHLAAFQGHTEVIELLVDQYSVDPGTLSSVRSRHRFFFT